jgi:hypothetical protein
MDAVLAGEGPLAGPAAIRERPDELAGGNLGAAVDLGGGSPLYP